MGGPVPRYVPPHFPIDEIPSGISSMGKNKTPVTQSLTTHFGWLVSHFKPMGVSFHCKKPEFDRGGTNRVFCQYFIDLTRSMAKKTQKTQYYRYFFPPNHPNTTQI